MGKAVFGGLYICLILLSGCGRDDPIGNGKMVLLLREKQKEVV
jgi:hypothetical protein